MGQTIRTLLPIRLTGNLNLNSCIGISLQLLDGTQIEPALLVSSTGFAPGCHVTNRFSVVLGYEWSKSSRQKPQDAMPSFVFVLVDLIRAAYDQQVGDGNVSVVSASVSAYDAEMERK